MGYRIPFLSRPPLSAVPIPMPSYNPSPTKRVALGVVTQALIAKGAVEIAPLPSPGFYSCLFVVWKTSGSWRLVIDLSTLNRFMDVSHFRMETIQSVLLSVRQGDWMASIDLKEAYLQVPIHPESRPFLRFVAHGRTYQFTALCFGLSTAPQVFSRVMAPVSAILHSWGIRMRRYLDDWLVQSSSRESLLQDLQVVLDLCRELGIVINPEKSNVEPSQVVQYFGVVIDAQTFVASPSPECIARLQSTAGEFLSSAEPVSGSRCWACCPRCPISSLEVGSACVPYSCFSTSLGIGWISQPGFPGLRTVFRICGGGSTCPAFLRECFSVRCLPTWTSGPMPRTSVGGAHLGHHTASGLRSHVEVPLSINAKELMAVRRGLLHFQSSLVGKTISVFCDNSTAVAYLRKEGGTRSPFLNSLAQGILRWSESLAIRLAPQFILGSLNVLADTLSRPHQLPHTEWSLNQDVFRSLSRVWPVQIDLFATSENRQCSIFFSPFRDPLAAGTDAFLQSWDGLQAYAFPQRSIIPRVLAKLRESRGTELTLVAPYWP